MWIALGNPDARSHRTFQRVIREGVTQRLPTTLSATCRTDGTARGCELVNLNVTVKECDTESNLGSFAAENAERLVGKSLFTTRRAFIDDSCAERRRKLPTSRKRLSSREVDDAHARFPSVGLVDFL